jgi:hypothetical protein
VNIVVTVVIVFIVFNVVIVVISWEFYKVFGVVDMAL